MPSEPNFFHDFRKNAKIELITAIFLHNVATDHRSTTKKKLAHSMSSFTVSGQNTIGIYITQLVLIQPADIEQNTVINNWLLKLQPAVKLQSWQKSNFHQIKWDLQIHNSDEILRSLRCHNIYFYIKIKKIYHNHNAILILFKKNWIFANFVT